MRETYRRPSLFWPVLFIGLGVLLLLQNFNLLPAGLWGAVAQLWPVVFILMGLDMLLGRRSAAAAVAVLAAGVLIVAGLLGWGAWRASQLPPGGSQPLFEYAHSAEQLEVSIDFAAGDLEVSDLGASGYVMEGQAEHGVGERLRQDYAVEAGTGRLHLAQEVEPLLLPFTASRSASAHWRVQLDPGLPLSLTVKTGAGTNRLDLSRLALRTLALSTGVGQSRVIFPDTGPQQARLTTGLGETILEIPAGLPARITVRSAIGRVQVPARFRQAGNVYTTPGFEPRGDYLDLELQAGIGTVIVK
jgi:hypothetical protein